MSEEPRHALAQYLAAELPSLRDETVTLIRENIAFYRQFPEDKLKSSVGWLLGLFVEKAIPTWDLSKVVPDATAVLRTRLEGGLGRDGALAIPTWFRRVFLHRLGSLLEAGLPDIPRLLLFVDEFCDGVSEETRRIYDDAFAAAQKTLTESEARYRAMVELSPDGIIVYRDRRFVYANQAAARMLAADTKALVGVDVLDHFPPEQREDVTEKMRLAEATGGSGRPIEQVMMRTDGVRFAVELMGSPTVFEGVPARQVVFRDITERKQAEDALKLSAMQEEIIRAQAATLREVSTPLIPVSDGVLVMPIVGHLDQVRAEQMREVLLSGISSAGARVALLDVTGVPAMDGEVASALLSAVSAARLLGAEVVLTGIKPAAAQALVELGVDFGQVVTRGTLKDGIAHALARERR